MSSAVIYMNEYEKETEIFKTIIAFLIVITIDFVL